MKCYLCLIFFVSFFPQSKPDPMKGKICELIQCWSHAFRNEPNYKVVQDTFNLMKMEGKVVWRFVAIKMIQIFRYALLITDKMCNLILKFFFFWIFDIEIIESWMFNILTILFVTGYTFPTLKEADAMFMAEKAPEWKEGDLCARCRTRFGTFNRQVWGIS